jgi:hypothetical protein
MNMNTDMNLNMSMNVNMDMNINMNIKTSVKKNLKNKNLNEARDPTLEQAAAIESMTMRRPMRRPIPSQYIVTGTQERCPNDKEMLLICWLPRRQNQGSGAEGTAKMSGRNKLGLFCTVNATGSMLRKGCEWAVGRGHAPLAMGKDGRGTG